MISSLPRPLSGRLPKNKTPRVVCGGPCKAIVRRQRIYSTHPQAPQPRITVNVVRTHMFDAYSFYEKSDPDHNRNFSRRWSERPLTPAEIDRLSDHELSVGHHQRAEMLAWRAAAMREAM